MFKRIVALILVGLTLQGKIIIWDLGDVLVKNDKIGIAREIGISHLAARLFLDRKSPHIQQRLFEVLGELDKDPEHYWKGRMPDGSHLPPIMCRWMAGLIKGSDMLALFDQYFALPENHSFFISEREKALFRRTIEVSFNPEILAAHTYIVDEGLAILKECTEARDAHGMPHRHIVLSNWDPEAFTLFHDQNPEFFRLFDDLIVSGFIGMIKPHKEIFHYLLKTYNFDPKECIFIDDQQANIIAARECGIPSILFNKYNYSELREHLVEAGILTNED